MKNGMQRVWLGALVGTLLWGCGGSGDSEKGSLVGRGSEQGNESDADSASGYDWLWGSDAEEDTESGEQPALPPFSRAFDGLVQNEARWATFRVALRAARLERGMDDRWNEDDANYLAIPPDTTYVELDVAITNSSRFDNELRWRSTWDLILKDGTRLEQSNSLELDVAPMGVVPFTLRYEVEKEVDLRGAQLELNGVERGVFAPERIPLDAPYHPDLDVELDELVGKVLTSPRENEYDSWKFQVLEATVSRNSPSLGRAEYGRVYVDLLLYATQVSDPSGFRLSEDYFTLIVDGKLVRPLNDIREDYDEDTGRVPVVFALEDTVKAFTVRFMVGDDSDLEPERFYQSVDVTL